jgi:hypothetical protein
MQKGETMKDNLRVSVAYVAGSIINKKNYLSLIDRSRNCTIKMNGSFALGNIDVNILDDGSKVLGMMNGNDLSFFHSVENVTISMKLDGVRFKGHDSGMDNDFTGSVNGKTVMIYDDSDCRNFYYELCDS